MHISKGGLLALLSVAALAGSSLSAVSALADHGSSDGGRDDHPGRHDQRGHHGEHGRHHHDRADDHGRHNRVLLVTPLAPSVPADPALNGAAPGGLPWVLRGGSATLHAGGTLRVRVKGLVIPAPSGDGTPGPVMTVTASLYCDGASTPTGTTPAVTLSRTGNASMVGRVTLPAKCLAPLVLVNPNGGVASYIAAAGFGG